ncbi:hypothetical protein DPQ33_00585 [Oceanidesulfovibrio indonesiensis]|uniref:Uncharacterized protein n=1 Tax=Oceanidesulfovibrio indonesiensis TaxID=54767 RepID=A0A7M3MJM3_9BACT|nr:hypothetical protein [Oceanidesulfovibrio indonesiensis]TVM19768.1 hypothetical protein DPQ33_00585 [Oceanidesulfovibrio indonesiensis]
MANMISPQTTAPARALRWLACDAIAPRTLYSGHDRLERLAPGSALLYRGRLWCLVRTSRLRVPFWGVKQRSLDTFDGEPYALLLLDGPGRGWCLPRVEVEALLRRNAWPKSQTGEYKIKPANIPDAVRFESTPELLRRLDAFVALHLGQRRNVQ